MCNTIVSTSNMTSSRVSNEESTMKQNKNPSLCIPRINSHFQKWQIHQVFEKLHIGKIKRIDQSYNHNTNTKRVFIHFDFWYKNEKVEYIQTKLSQNKHINIVYDDFHFWKCYLSKKPKK